MELAIRCSLCTVAAQCLNLLGGLLVVLGAKLLEIQSRKVVIELDVADLPMIGIRQWKVNC